MSARFAVALLVLILAPAARGDDAPRFAVAGGDGAQACVALPLSAQREGRRIDVRVPDGSSYRAHVGGRLSAACAALAGALVDGPFRAIAFDDGTPAGRWFGIADGGGARADVVACTSREGLHLTAWAGAPRRSGRLFHAYVYLGYDVEPTCAGDSDIAP